MSLLATILVLGVASATPAAVCGNARSAVERAVCAAPALRNADAAMAKSYADLRRSASPAAAAGLRASQRGWIAARDGRCGGGGVACLTQAYAARQAELDALAASAEASGGRLRDATVVMVRGQWKATRILDPEGAPDAPADPNLAKTLLFADLPQLGETVQARAGELCLKDGCRDVGWRATRLDEETKRLASALKRPGGSPMYVGANGGRLAIRLIPGAGGALLAAFALCPPKSDDCRNGFEEWVPLGPDARVEVVRPPAP